MSITQIQLAPRLGARVPFIVPDRRRHKRVPLTLLGRFMRQNRQEFPCKLRDISVGGAAIMSPVEVAPDEHVVVYFDLIGGLEGTVVRVFEGGFGMRLAVTPHKREKLAAQLTYLINRHEIESDSERRHERLAPRNVKQNMTLPDGVQISVEVLDVSISGASVATTTRPVTGSEVRIGNLRARVVRHHASGIGVAFSDIQNPNALRRHFG